MIGSPLIKNLMKSSKKHQQHLIMFWVSASKILLITCIIKLMENDSSITSRQPN